MPYNTRMPRDLDKQVDNPLSSRYASSEMVSLFLPAKRIQTWRRLWIALAEGQQSLGIKITKRQIDQMKRAADKIDFEAAAEYERRFRHDVMAHVHAFGDAAPAAKGIIHLGATSAFVVDNADLILMREALHQIRVWLVNVIDALADFAKKYAALPTLGYTHFQPAQLTTVGKRAVCWCSDYLMDLQALEFELGRLRLRGAKGTTGTQASFLSLLKGDADKVRRLEQHVAKSMGFQGTYPVTGQTYSRKVDAQVIGVLSGIAASTHKLANDIRLLSNLRELAEPQEVAQVGSSAMPYKQNPMRSERATSLARFIMSLSSSVNQTAAEQWLERTLDDSAHKRLCIPQAFLACDGMLRVITNVVRGLRVFPKIIGQSVERELPQLASENILMAAANMGKDRQAVHECIRNHARKTAKRMQDEGQENDLLERLKSDPLLSDIPWKRVLNPKEYVGLAPQQTRSFIQSQIAPLRRRHRKLLGINAELEV